MYASPLSRVRNLICLRIESALALLGVGVSHIGVRTVGVILAAVRNICEHSNHSDHHRAENYCCQQVGGERSGGRNSTTGKDTSSPVGRTNPSRYNSRPQSRHRIRLCPSGNVVLSWSHLITQGGFSGWAAHFRALVQRERDRGMRACVVWNNRLYAISSGLRLPHRLRPH